MSPFPQKSALPVSAGSRSRAGAGQRWRCGRWTRTLWLSHLSPHCTPSIPISRNWTVFWALSSKAGCWSEDLDFLCQYFLEGEVFVECIWWQLVLHCSHLYFVFCCVLSFLKFSFLFYFYLAGCSQPQLGSSVHCLLTVYLTHSNGNTHLFWSWANSQGRRPQPRELLGNEKLISGLSDLLLFWPPGLLDFLLREFSLPPPCITVVRYHSSSSVIDS